MQVALSQTTSRLRDVSSLAESLVVRKAEKPQWISCSVSASLRRTSTRIVLGKIGAYAQKKISLQVLCSQRREIPTLEASSMEEIYDALAERLIPRAAAANPNLKHVVGLAGPPGAGKSTVAFEVAQRVNKLWPQKVSSFDSQVWPPNVAIVLPMDGFHLYRHQLDKMENPEEAHARRGAPWTFDPKLLLSRLRTLRDRGSIYMPSFDHGVGDPIEDDIFVSLQHKVVIVEGNYLLLEEGSWKDVASVFDEKWFIDVDIDAAMQRVLNRHISTGKQHPDIAKWRIEYNDQPNAELINKSKKNADLVIRSVNMRKCTAPVDCA